MPMNEGGCWGKAMVVYDIKLWLGDECGGLHSIDKVSECRGCSPELISVNDEEEKEGNKAYANV
ncbi:MAG: hypothetical protein KJ985_15275, partial [Proteobacteria bacterium]|nr:hypothetical protein [Pseudomonadota bacterium]